MKVTARLNHDLFVEFDSVEDCQIFIANFTTYEAYEVFCHALSAKPDFLYHRAKKRDFSRIMDTVKTTDGRFLKEVLKK